MTPAERLTAFQGVLDSMERISHRVTYSGDGSTETPSPHLALIQEIQKNVLTQINVQVQNM